MKTITRAYAIACMIVLALFSIQLNAQDKCGYDMAHDYFMSSDPSYSEQYKKTNEQINAIIEAQRSQRQMTTGVLDIPIVVHVVHIGEPIGTGSNLSDAQILGAIQGMNDKYKGVNGFGVDMQIHFCLAVRDPNGNPTTGINRVNGSGVTNYVSSGMYAIAGVSPGSCTNNYNAIKDLSKWPTASYLNIWVVYKYCLSAGLNLYGQATGQTGSPYDGVTILYTQMTQSSITLAHECGHMLLLNHTFLGDGGGSVCPADTACANTGDLVCDTPPHKTNDWGATNPCSASGIWDNSRYNYMGYAWAAGPTATFNETTCRFTQGQKDRARAAIQALTTENYLNSGACTPPSALDAGIKTFIYPVKTTYTSDCSFPNSIAPVVQLKNYGLSTLTSVNINYRSDSGPVSSYVWSGSLLKDSVISVTLPAVSLSAGVHTLLAYTSSPNGGADTFNSNDSADRAMNYVLNQISSATLTVTGTDPVCAGGNDGSASVTASSSASKFTVKEDWESATDWVIVNGSEVNHWMIGTGASNGGTKGIYITSDNSTNNYMINSSSSVHFYKDFHFPANATNIKIKFDWRCVGEAGGFSGVDRLRVYLVPTTVFPQPGYQMGTAPSFTLSSIGSYYSQPTFKTDSITGLDANAGSIVRLIFNWRNNVAYGTPTPAAVDNIIVSYDLPSTAAFSYAWSTVPVQSTPTATSLTANTYTVSVSDANNCISTASVVINQPAPFNVSITANDTTTFCPGDSVMLTASAAASYLWSNGSTMQNTTITSSGNYTVTASDVNGCSGTSSPVSVVVLAPGSCATAITEKNGLSQLSCYPNPSSDHLVLEGDVKNGTYSLLVRNAIGQVITQQELEVSGKRLSRQIPTSALSDGIYFLSIQSGTSIVTMKFSKHN